MANMYLTSTAKFKPYTFDEMIKPDVIYTQAYNQVEDTLSDLGIMAGDVGGKLDATRDADLLNIYNTFKGDLDSVSNELYNKGLTPDTRKKLANLKSRYSKEINPINDAYKAWADDRETLAKLAIEHPEIIIQGRGDRISDYMNGNKPAGISVNTNDLFTRGNKLAAADAIRTYRETPWQNTANGKFLERNKIIGLSDVEFESALREIDAHNIDNSRPLSPNAQAILNSMNTIIAESNYGDLTNANKAKAMNAIISGIRSGYAYKVDNDLQQDPDYAYKIALGKEAAKRKQIIADTIGTELFLTPNDTKQEIGTKIFKSNGPGITNEIQNKYDTYFGKDGKLRSADDVRKALMSSIDPTEMGFGVHPGTIASNTVDTNLATLKEAMLDLGLDPTTATKEDLIRAFNSQDNSDVSGMVLGTITSNKAGFDVIKNNIQRGMLNNPTLETVVGRNEDNSYRTKPIQYEDLLTGKDNDNLDVVSVDVNYTNGQTTFKVNTKKGVKSILMPKGAHFNWTGDIAMKNRAAVIRDLSRGVFTTKDANGKINEVKLDSRKAYNFGDFRGTPEQYKLYLQELMNEELLKMFNYFGAQNLGS